MKKKEGLNIRESNHFFIDKSFDDKEGCCIHVPVRMIKIEGVPDVNIEKLDQIMSKICDKYRDKNIDFTGEWKTLSEDDEVKEYLFFYKQKK